MRASPARRLVTPVGSANLVVAWSDITHKEGKPHRELDVSHKWSNERQAEADRPAHGGCNGTYISAERTHDQQKNTATVITAANMAAASGFI